MLDQYLSKGYYRLGPYVFTTDHIRHPEGNFPVVWLRYRLQGNEPDKKQVRLLRGLGKFELFLKPLKLTEELERLFYRYKYMVSFDTSFSLQHLLYDEFDPALLNEEIFPSSVLEVRSEGELIAAGIIDLGEKSSAGIVNFYSPDHKKYSLGKALMVKKMMLSKELGMDFYYPGYIAYGFSKFDYKLFLGEDWAELYDPVSGEWVSYSKERLSEIGEGDRKSVV